MWCAGAVAGLLVMGPGLAPGSLLNLDLVVVPDLPVPPGVWGLGPELPRRVPFFLPMSWASTVVGTAAAKALMVAAVAVAFAGAARLVGMAPVLARLGAGTLYALSPFTLTRIGAGQLALLAAMALLPWALPRLLRPADDLRTTFLWAAALGGCGISGAQLAVPVVVVGIVAARGRRALAVLAALTVAQLPWLVPALVVRATGGSPDLGPASAFATDTSGDGGIVRVLGGHGFWQLGNQVGRSGGLAVALIGIVLGGLAVFGASRLPAGWRVPATVAAAIGLAVALASAIPGVDSLYDDLAETAIGAPLRDGQRMLALYLVWMAPAAALGAVRLSGTRPGAVAGALTALPAALALVLAGPGFWGLEHRLEPVEFPGDWAVARTAVDERPGAVLALPFNQYLDLRFADGRRCLNPAPDYFGGDVLASTDPELGPVAQEGLDPRTPGALEIVERLRAGDPAAGRLARLGVRWVFLMKEIDWREYRGVRSDPGLDRVVDGPDAALYRVRGWEGPVRTADGATPALDPVVAPLAELEGSTAAVWAHPGSAGWLRGTEGTGTTNDGLLRLPAGSGPLWYWPALLVLAGDGLVLVALVLAWRRRIRGPE